MSRVSSPLFAGLIALATPWVAVGQDSKEAPAKILSPKAGASVNHIEFLEGRIEKPGHPVVLVMPMAGDQPWYAQELVEGVEPDGAFTARTYIGEEKVPKAIKFRIVVLIAKDEKEAGAKYAPGKQIKNLPAQVGRSEIMTVVREPE